ncbi:hypothetical protein F546_15010, partial [Vibrio paracholerae 877-163]
MKNSRLRLVFSLGFFAFGLAYSTAWGKPPKQTIHWGEFKLRWGRFVCFGSPVLGVFCGKKPPANVTLSPLTFD